MKVLSRQASVVDFQDVVLRCNRREKTFLNPPWNLQLQKGDKIAVIAANRKMRDEFLGCIYGLIKPVSGYVVPNGVVSWPLGLKGGLDSKLSLSQNIRFLESVYEDRVAPLNSKKFLDVFYELTGLTPEQKLKSLKSKEQKIFYIIIALIFLWFR